MELDELYEIAIKEQILQLPLEKWQELSPILKSFGILHKSNKCFAGLENGIYIVDCGLSIRALNCICRCLECHGFGYQRTTIQQFATYFSKLDFIKTRNCGKRTVAEVDAFLKAHGFQWRNE